MTTLQCQQLDIQIANKTVCRNLTLAFHAGENWAILGMNGSGKTTLLHTLAGLHTATAGVIHIGNQPLALLSRRHIAQQLALLLQQQEDHFPGTVLEAVLVGRHPHIRQWQWESETDRQLATQALTQLGLQGFEQRSILSLSGGERQRVALATLLVQQTPIRLLDEPLNHLDIHHQHEVMQLLTADRSCSNLFVLHDINLAWQYCDHALLLFGNGETLYGKRDEVLTESHLSRLYQHPLRSISQQQQQYFVADSSRHP